MELLVESVVMSSLKSGNVRDICRTGSCETNLVVVDTAVWVTSGPVQEQLKEPMFEIQSTAEIMRFHKVLTSKITDEVYYGNKNEVYMQTSTNFICRRTLSSREKEDLHESTGKHDHTKKGDVYIHKG